MTNPVVSIVDALIPNPIGGGRLVLLAGALLVRAAPAVAADAAAERGFRVAARSARSDSGFGDSSVTLRMVLRSKTGTESIRSLTLHTLETPDEAEGNRSLLVFESPPDIEGTALLSHAKILEPDDQWLYLPALKRVKRISSINKSGPFVGSEFAFEDFTALELNKYTYRFLRTDAYEDAPCDVIEQVPRYEHSGYTRQVSWIDQDAFQVRKVEYFDRRGELLKTLRLADYRQYERAYWRAHALYMVNHKTGKSTDLLYEDYSFQTDLTDRDFDRGILTRIR